LRFIRIPKVNTLADTDIGFLREGAMADDNGKPEVADELPFVAPCRQLPAGAPFEWLKLGWQDLTRAPMPSLALGAVMAALVAAMCILAYAYGSYWFMFAMLAGFVFLAPLTCIGAYAISAQLERDEPVDVMRILRAAGKRYINDQLVFSLVLLVIFLIWARAGSMVSVFFPMEQDPRLFDLLAYFGIGTIVGGFFTLITFCISAFSLPMIMHRNVDTITAVITSVNAVLRNRAAMLTWVTLIGLMLLFGLATGFIGLIVILPLIGFASWHAYLQTIDASAFPRHDVGITAKPRPNPPDIDYPGLP